MDSADVSVVQPSVIRVESEVRMAMTMKTTVFWNVVACSFAVICQSFGGTCCVHQMSLVYPEDRGSKLL